jgi:hypothetical protein
MMRVRAVALMRVWSVSVACLCAATGAAQGVDLTIAELRFSAEAPTEGDPVTLTAFVQNVGTEPLTHDKDVDVWFFEGDPDTGALQVQAENAATGLAVGEVKPIRAKFRPRSGRFDIHAIVNPDPAESRVIEANRTNNEGRRLLTVAARSFRRSTDTERAAAVERGVRWVLDQQGEFIVKCPQDGIENPVIVPNCVICGLSLAGLPVTKKESPAWSPTEGGPGATSLAVLTLVAAGLDPSHPALAAALAYLLERDWNSFDVYDLAVVIPALVATQMRSQYLERVRFAVNRLLDRQLRIEKGVDARDDGGWGYGSVGDGAHMQYAIYALYAAKQWGVEIPRIAWEKAEKWVRSTQHRRGGWNYNLIESPWAEGPYGSMTATGLMAMKMLGVPLNDPQFVRGMKWLEDHYTVTSNPGSFHWHLYFLLSLQRMLDTPPQQQKIGSHDWYAEMADYLVGTQYPDGRWEENGEAFSSTAFAILFLTRYLPPSQAPDLSVVPSSIRTTPTTPAEGTPVSLQFTLTNLGRPLQRPVPVEVYDAHPADRGQPIASVEVLFPLRRADATATVTWKAQKAGVYDIYVAADPRATLPDLDRGNNFAAVRLQIAPPHASARERAQTALRELRPGVYQIGTVVLDRNRNEVAVPGQVWDISGLGAGGFLEYLATGILGKVHESVLVLDVDPIHLQTALLALGLDAENNLRAQGDTRVPRGDPVLLWVTWERNGQRERHRAEEIVFDVRRQAPMPQTHWVFTGSRFQGNLFMAESTQSLIATYRDPDAILNNPLPEGGDDEAYRPNRALLPPKGTPISLLIQPATIP